MKSLTVKPSPWRRLVIWVSWRRLERLVIKHFRMRVEAGEDPGAAMDATILSLRRAASGTGMPDPWPIYNAKLREVRVRGEPT